MAIDWSDASIAASLWDMQVGRLFALLGVLGIAIAQTVACGSDATQNCGLCPEGTNCVGDRCLPDGDDSSSSVGGVGGASSSSSSDVGGSLIGAPNCPMDKVCQKDCCQDVEFCALGTSCAPQQDPCSGNDDCWFDSYCLNGECIPYELPPSKDRDEDCKTQITIDKIAPEVQCRWTAPPASDPYPNHVHVMATPIVVDFDFDSQPSTLAPSIVFTSFPGPPSNYKAAGILRIIDGKDCSQQFSFGIEDATMSPASVAAGDIDGDGRAEIVAATHSGGLLAFQYNVSTKSFKRLWRSGTCNNKTGPVLSPDNTGGADKWNGPSIHDLNDDGIAEIIYGGTVYNNQGCILSNSLGFANYGKGYVPVIADIDEDGKMELITGNKIYEWDAQNDDWLSESYFVGTVGTGQVAVAEMGSNPLASQNNADRAEIVVVASGSVRIQTIEGNVVFGPYPIPGGGTGGPPTIADFDGDGKNEFATAGGSQYVVYDQDCLANGNVADCNGQAKTNGILWAQPSKDASSNVTGSSVFDFDADGSAEAVYADECFLRIYDGSSGNVKFSAARSSGTTYENPVIADVDGDFRTEIVSAVNDYANLGCPSSDPLFPSSTFASNRGIVVLRDVEDRWAASRPVWNQHAYAVTHVGDQGQTPKSSAVALNWKQPGLNNFRQNVQGNLDALGVPDLTAGGDVGAVACDGTLATVEARICNRGTLPMVSGTKVNFYETDTNGKILCDVAIPIALQVAECTVVSCQSDLAGKTIDMFVLVDPDAATDECHENNNAALYRGVACGKIPQ